METTAAPREAEIVLNDMPFSLFSMRHHCGSFNDMFTSVNFMPRFGSHPHRR